MCGSEHFANSLLGLIEDAPATALPRTPISLLDIEFLALSQYVLCLFVSDCARCCSRVILANQCYSCCWLLDKEVEVCDALPVLTWPCSHLSFAQARVVGSGLHCTSLRGPGTGNEPDSDRHAQILSS
jgi:hypothetical protein